MKKITKIIIALIVMMAGLAFMAPAANASGNSVTVESTSYVETSAKADVKSEVRAIVDGATQITWEEPNHNIVITAETLKKAPRIKVNATGANSSKVIFKTAKAKLFKKYKKTMSKKKAKKRAVKDSQVVILKAGSCVRNTGKLNKLRRGFVWCPDTPVVVKYDSKSKQYRHTHSLLTASSLEALKKELEAQNRSDELEVVGTINIGGVEYSIVKWCANYIGGNVEMLVKVIQVRYEGNLLIDIELESRAETTANVKASLQCPSGTLYGEASASATGHSTASIRVQMKTKDASIEAEKSRILAEARIKAKTSALAAAQAKVKLECGDTPPPPPVTPAPVFMQFREFNDLYKSLPETPTTMDHCVTVDFPEGHSGEVFWTAELGSFTTPRKTAQDGAQVCSTYTAPSEAGHDTITVTATDSVSGKSVTKTSRAFVIKEWPAIP